MNYTVKEKLCYFIPYTAALLYGEILYLMLVLTVLYGKTEAVIIGLSASSLLALHILRLYMRLPFSRTIHYIILTLHTSYAAAYVITQLLHANSITHSIEILVLIYRAAAVLVGIPAIVILTDRNIRSQLFTQRPSYSQQ